MRRDLFMTGKPVMEGGGGGPLRWMFFLLGQLLFAVCLACLYLGMRGIMRLGGFVASGGPYEIAHPAPGWVWILPVSIIVGMISVFVSLGAGHRIGGPSLMSLAWSALFLSLGWNFLEFGLHPPVGDGLVWGWLICGVLFVPMGAFPLWIILATVRDRLRERRRARAVGAGTSGPHWGFSLILQALAVAAGVYLGVLLFASVSTPVVRERPVAARPADGDTFDFHARGRTLSLVSTEDGRWKFRYQGRTYERIRDLPAGARRLFEYTLKHVKEVPR